MAKLLTIETGFTCNSRCHYCTQLDYRVIPQADQLDLSTEQIRERIAFAAKNGYDQIGFSGGEPTIRPDFLDLIAFAKSLDFERIGVTTNGRMFAYPAFAQRAVRAGLDSFTFSLHGPTPQIHDDITAAPGALQQALAGLANLKAAADKQGIRLHLMNNQIILPSNVQYIAEMVEMLAPLGVRLFMIQPFISQRSNVEELGRFYVPYQDVVDSVQRALPVLRQYGARIKPYNVPNCLLTPLGRDVVEPQFYGITVFREYETAKTGEYKAFKVQQWYRVDACKTCTEVCPGFRIEQLPQEQMQAQIVQAYQDLVVNRPRQPGDGPLIVGGTELLEPRTVRQTLRALAAVHGPVAWMTSGCERSTRPELVEVICDLAQPTSEGPAPLAELVLFAQPLDQRFLAQRVLEKGNLEALRQLLFLLGAARLAGKTVPKLRLFLDQADWVRLHDDESVSAQLPALRKALQAATDVAVDVCIAVSNFAPGQTPPDMDRQADRNRTMAQRLHQLAVDAGLQPYFITLEDQRGLDPLRAAEMHKVEAQFSAFWPQQSWARRLIRHPLCAASMDFVSWFPPWLFERPDGAPQRAHVQPGDSPSPAPDESGGSGATGLKTGTRGVAVARLLGKRDPAARRLGPARWERQGVLPSAGTAPTESEPIG